MFELTNDRRDILIEQWARALVKRGLAPAAVFLLEAHKPLYGLGAQAVLAFKPLLAPLVPLDVNELAAFMHNVENVELLMRRVETLDAEHRATERAARQHQRQVRARAKRLRRLRKQSP